MKKNYITIYSEDYDNDIWKEYCDICNVPYDATEITIKFNDKDLSYN